MATSTLVRPAPLAPPPGPAPARRAPLLVAALGVEALTLLALVIPGGTVTWAVVRALTVVGATAALWYGLRASGAAGRGVSALVAGTAGVAAGAGIGAGHVAKSVFTVTTWLGLVTLAMGLILLVAGAVLLVRATPGWWRLLALPVAFGLVQFLLLPLGMAVYATNVPPTRLGADSPAQRGLVAQDVLLRTADGVELSAWYIPSTNRAAVLLLHGAGSTRTDVLAQAAVLAQHGYGVLMPDARGHGRSGGHAMDFGWYGRLDIDAGLVFLGARPDVDPARIGAVGESMGAEQALTVAGSDARIRAVVAEGVTGRVSADYTWLGGDLTGLITRAENVVVYGAASLLTSAPRPEPLRDAVARTAGRPVLIIASGAAGEIPAAASLRAAAPGSVQVWELPDTGHTQGLAQHPAEWTARVIAFLDRSLLP